MDYTNVVNYMRSSKIHHIYLVLCLCYLFSYTLSNNLTKETGVYKCNALVIVISLYVMHLILSVTSHINCIIARCLIDVFYLMACAFIRS